jgi:hypothetical protein
MCIKKMPQNDCDTATQSSIAYKTIETAVEMAHTDADNPAKCPPAVASTQGESNEEHICAESKARERLRGWERIIDCCYVQDTKAYLTDGLSM